MKEFLILSLIVFILYGAPSFGADANHITTDDTPSVLGSWANKEAANDPVYKKTRPTSKKKPTKKSSSNKVTKKDASSGNTDQCFASKACQSPEVWDPLLCKCLPQANSETSNSNRDNEKQDLEAEIQKCSEDTEIAKSDCDQSQDSGVQGAQTTLSNFATGLGSQLGISGACSGISKYVAAANAAVLYFNMNCSNSRSNCVASCKKARAAVTTHYSGKPHAGEEAQAQVTDLLTTCKDLDAKVQQGTMAIQNMVGLIQSAQACAKQTDPALADYCTSNPGAIGCSKEATDCSNPSIAASNTICICKNNPSSATCTGALAKASSNRGFDSAKVNPLDGGGSGTNSPDFDNLMGEANWAGDPNLKADQRPSEEVGGKKKEADL